MELLNYGVLGIVVVALAGYVLKIEARHRSERSEWKQTIDKQFDKQNDATEKYTSILSALKTLLESRR